MILVFLALYAVSTCRTATIQWELVSSMIERSHIWDGSWKMCFSGNLYWDTRQVTFGCTGHKCLGHRVRDTTSAGVRLTVVLVECNSNGKINVAAAEDVTAERSTIDQSCGRLGKGH